MRAFLAAVILTSPMKDELKPLSRNSSSRHWLNWLTPGIGVKRHFALFLLGAVLLGLAFAIILVEAAEDAPGSTTWVGLPLWLWALSCAVIGLGLAVLATIRINQAILKPLSLSSSDLVQAVMDQRSKDRGPRIVAIGGGTGMPAVLSGLKAYTSNLTAIVTVADDGGSSGRLRRETGTPPPGDIRNNIAALARDEALMTQLFQYRFGDELEGHSFGNLFIAAMKGITGSFEEAVAESGRVLAIRGKVIPSTLADVTLEADVTLPGSDSVTRIAGESAIAAAGGHIDRLYITPADVSAYPEARKAILSAELIVIGPGSLFTSILPNLLVKEISLALRATRAMKVYVCNVATQAGETSGYTVGDHVDAIERHVGAGVFDHVLVNSEFPPIPPESRTVYVAMSDPGSHPHLAFHLEPLADPARPWRHHPEKVARSVMKVFEKAAEGENGQAAPYNQV